MAMFQSKQTRKPDAPRIPRGSNSIIVPDNRIRTISVIRTKTQTHKYPERESRPRQWNKFRKKSFTANTALSTFLPSFFPQVIRAFSFPPRFRVLPLVCWHKFMPTLDTHQLNIVYYQVFFPIVYLPTQISMSEYQSHTMAKQ